MKVARCFFSKHPSLVSTVFRGRIPTARSSSCALWPWVSEGFFLFGLMLFQNSCAENFLHKLEATPHLNGKHVVFGKVRSAKGAKRGSIECIQCNYYFRRRCKMEFTWNFRLKYDMRPFNLLHKLKIMSCKSSCKICFFCPTALVLGSQPQ